MRIRVSILEKKLGSQIEIDKPDCVFAYCLYFCYFPGSLGASLGACAMFSGLGLYLIKFAFDFHIMLVWFVICVLLVCVNFVGVFFVVFQSQL